MKHDVPATAQRVQRLIYRNHLTIVVFSAIFVCLLAVFILEHTKENFSDFNYYAIRSIVLAILSSLIIVSIIQLYTSDRNVDMLREEIGALFSSKLESYGVHLHGIVDVHDGMPHSRLKRYIADHNEMFILQTWIADFTVIKESLRQFCTRGGKLRIAILAPDSDIVDIRQREISASRQIFADGINSNIEELFEIGGDNIEIRLHQQTPSVSIYGFNDVIFVGNYLSRLHAVQGPQMEVKSGFYFDKIVEHFERVWKSPDTKKVDRLKNE